MPSVVILPIVYFAIRSERSLTVELFLCFLWCEAATSQLRKRPLQPGSVIKQPNSDLCTSRGRFVATHHLMSKDANLRELVGWGLIILTVFGTSHVDN